ncbi:MAG: iron export ABC transporter permease subunit FetB [Acholeplasmatales bacterium]|nr:MAG: iron export ABC transporter permease subunit FetB [Acholeplasmatales bacterium]
MPEGVLDLTYWQVGLAYGFALMVLVMLKRRGIPREKLLVWATFRMTLQLVLVGLLLGWVFDHPHPLLTALIVCVMVVFAVFTVLRKFREEMGPRLKKVVMVTLPLGTLPVIFFFILIVIQVRPYFNPRYVIPLTGMIIGNSMTGISLGLRSMIDHFKHRHREIEQWLILGAYPSQAVDGVVNSSFDAAILPTLNSMLGMGIIFLPGMMSGQILSGVDPTIAILYQIAIMMGILGGVSLTTYLFLRFGSRTFFNKQHQLVQKA